jgi:hypothetical protein
MNKEVLILSSFFDKDLISDVVNGVKSRNTVSYDDLINEVNKKNYFSRINLNFFLSKNYSTIEIFLGNEYIFKKILFNRIIFKMLLRMLLVLIVNFKLIK